MTAISSLTRKSIGLALAAATIAGTMTIANSDAEAQWRGRHSGAVAAGIVGGLALGALAASAHRPAYGYGPAYYVDEPSCYTVRRRVWNEYRGHHVVRRVRVCD